MPPVPPHPESTPTAARSGSHWIPLLLFGVLLFWSLSRVPIPAVNEPHYLGKAKHFWDPQWCAGDLFLESSNPHLVFYVTFGWLTRLFPLETSAVLGRCAGLLVLAIGWSRFSSALTGRRWHGLAALPLLLLLHSLGNFSGEWLVGGIESKVIAYGFLFWAIGSSQATARGGPYRGLSGASAPGHEDDRSDSSQPTALGGPSRSSSGAAAPGHEDDRSVSSQPTARGGPSRGSSGAAAPGHEDDRSDSSQPTARGGWPVETGITAGLAVSFHPLVGLWGLIAAGMATAGALLWSRFSSSPGEPAHCLRPSQLLLGGFVCVLSALPGLLPAAAAIAAGDPQVEQAATHLQVAHRLAHHLDPMTFPKESYRYFGLLLLVWFLLPWEAGSPRQRWWRLFVLSAVLIALAGVLLGWGPRPMKTMPGHEWRMHLLRFYPFRLADLMVPVAVSLIAAGELLKWATRNDGGRRLAALVLLAAAYAASTVIPGPDRNPSRLTAAQQRDWRAACAWILEETPPSALVYSADEEFGVKWFAQRPEYVNYKDFPQDAPSIIEWNRRLWRMANWKSGSLADGRVTGNELAELRVRTGIAYLICRRFGPIEETPVYANQTFRVYALPEEPVERQRETPRGAGTVGAGTVDNRGGPD